MQQHKFQDSGFAPSFSCYTSNNKTSTAITKVIREEQEARDIEDEDFEFSLTSSDEEVSPKEIDPRGWTVFKRDLLPVKDAIYVSSAITGPQPSGTKCKKSNSTGSGSKRWIFRYLLRRSNSEGKQPTALLTQKKVESPKHKRNSGERWKAQTPVHEQFYVQRRAENEVGKRKSYLPYRKDLVGLFANVNGMGKMLPF